MMLSNRDLSKTTPKNSWLLLIIITVVLIAATSEAKNQSNLKNSSTEVEVETSNELEDSSSTELEVKEEPYTSVWAMMYDWWNWMIGGYAQNKKNAVGEPRTFGAIRRLQMALIPIAFKFGIVFAMITVLVFLAMKTVFLLKLLLIMNAAAIFAKLLLSKSEHHYQPPPPWAGYNGWSHPPVPSWPIESPLNKEVHLHIHGSNLAHHPWERSDYGGYNNANGLTIDPTANELNNRGPLPYLRSTQNQANNYYVNGSG